MCACQLKSLVLLSASGYLLGSIPFGLLFSKLAGHGDIRKFGSGNIGATNAFRKSKALGAATLLCDLVKGVLAVRLASTFCEDYLIQLIVGVMAVAGHIFPVWLRFHGGKGVATALGVFLMTNSLVGGFACLTWACVFIVGRISGLASIATFVCVPFLTYFLTFDTRLVIVNSIIATLVVIRHRKNVRDIVAAL